VHTPDGGELRLGHEKFAQILPAFTCRLITSTVHGVLPLEKLASSCGVNTLTETVPVALSALTVPPLKVTVIGSLAASELVACNEPENVNGPVPRTEQLIAVPPSPSITLWPGSAAEGAGVPTG